MKRWEMVARALGCTEAYARSECLAFDQNYLAEMSSIVCDYTPDLGRDIAAAHIVVAAKGDDEWCDALMAKWTRLTGRAKEGE